LRFQTNGWGNKFVYTFDDQVGDRIAEYTTATIKRFPWVLEGGSVEHNGKGTILTTRECLLNPNRNPSWNLAAAELAIRDAFSANRVVWINHGLLNDHTDGHIDNIARFIAPNKVVCQKPASSDDPNKETLKEISTALRSEGFEVAEVTSPGRVLDDSGDIMPASHMNFIFGDGTVVVPTYGTESTPQALDELQQLFPDRRVVGSPSQTILTGGGSFHCITQQQPFPRG
jgi:agmatine deiminase